MAALRRVLADRAGVTAIEFAILGPVLLVTLIAVAEFGRMLWVENALQYAVAQAARCMTIDTSVCGDARETRDFAAASSGMSFPSSVFVVGPAVCGNRVSASYVFTFAAGLFPYTATLDAQSCYPL
jgi:Flp pilus assembly protein TadG